MNERDAMTLLAEANPVRLEDVPQTRASGSTRSSPAARE